MSDGLIEFSKKTPVPAKSGNDTTTRLEPPCPVSGKACPNYTYQRDNFGRLLLSTVNTLIILVISRVTASIFYALSTVIIRGLNYERQQENRRTDRVLEENTSTCKECRAIPCKESRQNF